jgi:hypothetical protein
MKQLGNLALVCARRNDVLFQILKGEVTVHIGDGPSRRTFRADWRDDDRIDAIVYEMNHGAYWIRDLVYGDIA